MCSPPWPTWLHRYWARRLQAFLGQSRNQRLKSHQLSPRPPNLLHLTSTLQLGLQSRQYLELDMPLVPVVRVLVLLVPLALPLVVQERSPKQILLHSCLGCRVWGHRPVCCRVHHRWVHHRVHRQVHLAQRLQVH